MKKESTMVALDCGNSSFRVVLGQYRDGKIESTVVTQVPNGMIRIGEYDYWDMLNILKEFKAALKLIISQGHHIDSIGICTWGVDFALFDRDGNMLSNPLCYRNTIGEEVLSKLSEEERKERFYETGILCDKINSVYMLSGMKEKFPQIFSIADKCLMVPDILNYFLTGQMVNEPSELSTTQLMDARTRKISGDTCRWAGVSEDLFARIGVHGEKIGDVRADILQEIGADYEIPVVCVPSHDTASAVAAIPAQEKNFGFVSCGTWSLIGTELDEPLMNDQVIAASLTNEVGTFGKITMLKNSAGMFIVNNLKKEYEFEKGRKAEWKEISELAENCKETPRIDLNDMAFFNPRSMSKAVWNYLETSGQVSGDLRWDILFRTFYESLAQTYAETFRNIEEITGKKFEKIYIVGGGSASRILLRLMAEYIGKPIVVCYGESTSMGNLGVQLKYMCPELTLTDIREMIGRSYKTEEVIPERRG